MNFVDHKHFDMGNSQEIDRLLLEVHDGGARIVGSSKGRQQLSV